MADVQQQLSTLSYLQLHDPTCCPGDHGIGGDAILPCWEDVRWCLTCECEAIVKRILHVARGLTILCDMMDVNITCNCICT